MRVWEPQSAYRAKKGDEWSALAERIAATTTDTEVEMFRREYLITKARDLPSDWTSLIMEACDERREEIAAIAANKEMDAIVGAIVRHG